MTEQVYNVYGPVNTDPRCLLSMLLWQIGFEEATDEFNEKYGLNYGWVLKYQDEDITTQPLYFGLWSTNSLQGYSSTSYKARPLLLSGDNHTCFTRETYYGSEYIYKGDQGSSSTNGGYPASCCCRVIKGDNFLIILPTEASGRLSCFILARTENDKIIVSNPGGNSVSAAPSSYYSCVTYLDPVNRAYYQNTAWTRSNSTVVGYPKTMVNSNTEQMATLMPLYMQGYRLGSAPTVDLVENLYLYTCSLSNSAVNSGISFKVGDDYYMGLINGLCLKLDDESIDVEGVYVSDYDYIGTIRGAQSVSGIPKDAPFLCYNFSSNGNVELKYESPEEATTSGRYSSYSQTNTNGWYYNLKRLGPGTRTYTLTDYSTSTGLKYTIKTSITIAEEDDESYKMTVNWCRLEVLENYSFTSGTYTRTVKKQILDLSSTAVATVWRLNGFGEGGASDTTSYIAGGSAVTPNQDKLSKSTYINLTAKIPRPLNRGTATLEGTLGKEELRAVVATSDKLYTMIKTVNDAEYKAVFKITATNNETLAGLRIQFQSATRGGGDVTSDSKFIIEYVTPNKTDTSGSGSGSGSESGTEEGSSDITYASSSGGTPSQTNWKKIHTYTGAKSTDEIDDDSWSIYRVVADVEDKEVSFDLTKEVFDKMRPASIEEAVLKIGSEILEDGGKTYTAKRGAKLTSGDETRTIVIQYTIRYWTKTEWYNDSGELTGTRDYYQNLIGIKLVEVKLDERNLTSKTTWDIWRYATN